MNIFYKDYHYFQRNHLSPIQIDSLKSNYTKLDLANLAIQIGEDADKFIEKFTLIMQVLDRLPKKD